MKICVAVPLHNAQSWLENFNQNPEYEYRFFDNASTDATREILKSKGYVFAYSDKLLSRPASWIETYLFASRSDAQWIKPLFAGDVLASGLSRIQIENPKVGIILFKYKISLSKGVQRTARQWKLTGSLSRDISMFGPFSGPPIAWMFSSEAIQKVEPLSKIHFSEWLADFQLFEILAKETEYAYLDIVSGTFNSPMRTTFKKLRKELSYFTEEMQLIIGYRKLIYPVSTLDKIKISKRIIDLGLHRLPNRQIPKVIITYVKEVWR
jgi:glycosyltransferase involved in cell wall biosynthesis